MKLLSRLFLALNYAIYAGMHLAFFLRCIAHLPISIAFLLSYLAFYHSPTVFITAKVRNEVSRALLDSLVSKKLVDKMESEIIENKRIHDEWLKFKMAAKKDSSRPRNAEEEKGGPERVKKRHMPRTFGEHGIWMEIESYLRRKDMWKQTKQTMRWIGYGDLSVSVWSSHFLPGGMQLSGSYSPNKTSV